MDAPAGHQFHRRALLGSQLHARRIRARRLLARNRRLMRVKFCIAACVSTRFTVAAVGPHVTLRTCASPWRPNPGGATCYSSGRPAVGDAWLRRAQRRLSLSQHFPACPPPLNSLARSPTRTQCMQPTHGLPLRAGEDERVLRDHTPSDGVHPRRRLPVRPSTRPVPSPPLPSAVVAAAPGGAARTTTSLRPRRCRRWRMWCSSRSTTGGRRLAAHTHMDISFAFVRFVC